MGQGRSAALERFLEELGAHKVSRLRWPGDLVTHLPPLFSETRAKMDVSWPACYPKVTEVIARRAKTDAGLRLLSGGKHLADATNGLALFLAEGEKLKAMVQALAITHQGAKLQGGCGKRERKLHGDDFAGFQLSGEGAANPI